MTEYAAAGLQDEKDHNRLDALLIEAKVTTRLASDLLKMWGPQTHLSCGEDIQKITGVLSTLNRKLQEAKIKFAQRPGT